MKKMTRMAMVLMVVFIAASLNACHGKLQVVGVGNAWGLTPGENKMLVDNQETMVETAERLAINNPEANVRVDGTGFHYEGTPSQAGNNGTPAPTLMRGLIANESGRRYDYVINIAGGGVKPFTLNHMQTYETMLPVDTHRITRTDPTTGASRTFNLVVDNITDDNFYNMGQKYDFLYVEPGPQTDPADWSISQNRR